jgi:hypothetical protein
VNVGMVIGLLPVTGIPLPFISYGGASLVSLAAGARDASEHESAPREARVVAAPAVRSWRYARMPGYQPEETASEQRRTSRASDFHAPALAAPSPRPSSGGPRPRPQARPLRRRRVELRPEGLVATALKWCFAYPDLYEIGMSNLGLRILYEVLNDRPDRLAERCFAPDVDLQAELRAAGVPLWSLETRRPLREFDVIGLSLGFELVLTNMLAMLDLGGIGLTTAERDGGRPARHRRRLGRLNPEPIADFVDAVVLGEGEDVVLEISDVLESIGWNRRPLRRGARSGVGE